MWSKRQYFGNKAELNYNKSSLRTSWDSQYSSFWDERFILKHDFQTVCINDVSPVIILAQGRPSDRDLASFGSHQQRGVPRSAFARKIPTVTTAYKCVLPAIRVVSSLLKYLCAITQNTRYTLVTLVRSGIRSCVRIVFTSERKIIPARLVLT